MENFTLIVCVILTLIPDFFMCSVKSSVYYIIPLRLLE
jgi:hypothetical protein